MKISWDQAGADFVGCYMYRSFCLQIVSKSSRMSLIISETAVHEQKRLIFSKSIICGGSVSRRSHISTFIIIILKISHKLRADIQPDTDIQRYRPDIILYWRLEYRAKWVLHPFCPTKSPTPLTQYYNNIGPIFLSS